MKIPKRLQPLINDGWIDEVLSRLMSGKEADIYVVRCGAETRCAKVYKEAAKRSFKKAAQYQEGRKVRNSRHRRAMEKSSKFGRKQQEETWQNAEVNALSHLARNEVPVPATFGCLDGVLLMELVVDKTGEVAPRLADVVMSAEEAKAGHSQVIHYVVRMLCAGMIHGDLSEFNILVGQGGPVIIDLPQAIDAAANNNAESMLERDVNNIRNYYGLFAPELLQTQYAKEMWELYKEGELHPDSTLTGYFEEDMAVVDVDEVLENIDTVLAEEKARLERLRVNDGDERNPR